MSAKTLGGVVAGIVTVVLACVMGGVVLLGGVAGACGIPADPHA